MIFQSATYSVLLVSASEKFNTTAQSLLPPSDFWPVTTVDSGAGARRFLRETDYDIVLINAPLPDESGVRLAVDVCAGSESGVLLLVKNELREEIYRKVLPHGAVTLGKPTSGELFSQSLWMLCSLRERLRSKTARQATVEEKIQEIQLLDRAKWLLIECLNMTEEEAHRYIAKQAMEQRITKRAAAENVIRTYQ